MSADAAQLKSDLRRKLRAAAQVFSAAERAAASTQICERLRKQAVWRQAESILFYFPLADEPDIHPLLADALAAGKTAALPRYCARDGHYEACQVRDLGGELQAGAFGIHEPAAVCPIFDLKKLDL